MRCPALTIQPRFLTPLLPIVAVTTFAFTPVASQASEIWKVPVIYVTDRQPLKTSFGPYRAVERDTVSRVHSGIAEVCVEQKNKTPLFDWQKESGLTAVDKKIAPAVTMFEGQSIKDLADGFDEAVKAAVAKSANKEIFIFVHGFNTSFREASIDAAHLGLFTGCPVVLYSWPSASKLSGYTVDECNNEWSQEHFNQFVDHLARLKESQKLKISIVIHSMGNRLFVRGIPIFSGKGLFSDIYMCNPDFDAQTFIHYLSRYIQENGLQPNVRAQLLISRKDKALTAAEALFGGYTRLGQGIDFTLSALTSPQQFGSVWSRGQGSARQTKTSGSVNDAKLIDSIEQSFRVYDVTAFDFGLIGHKIPYDFIAWMHHRNQPPPGFTLVEEKSKGPNKLSRFFEGKLHKDIGAITGSFWIANKTKTSATVSDQKKKD